MRSTVRTSASLFAVTALALCFEISAYAQSTASPSAGNGIYIATDPLANVRYDNRFDLSLGAAYGHIHAGPEALQGANLGGLDLSGSYWFSKRFAVEGTDRNYVGTSGPATNIPNGVHGPFVSEYIFAAGPEFLGPHNKHGDIMLHVLGGGAYFLSHDFPQTPASTGFYNNQLAPAAIFGGHIDLNRSARWVFRITPDALFTRYGYSFNEVPATSNPHTNWNFGISVGVEYKFKKKR
jgi:hypothetical protein